MLLVGPSIPLHRAALGVSRGRGDWVPEKPAIEPAAAQAQLKIMGRWVSHVGEVLPTQEIVEMDDRGRILIPSSIRKRLKSRMFSIQLLSEGALLLKPIREEIEGLGGKYRGVIKASSFEELEEAQEELLKKEGRI